MMFLFLQLFLSMLYSWEILISLYLQTFMNQKGCVHLECSKYFQTLDIVSLWW